MPIILSSNFKRIPYIGHPSNGNMGDEVLFQMCETILDASLWIPWKKKDLLRDLLVTLGSKRFILGGGSLLFTESSFDKIERWKKLRKIPVLFGTGSREIDHLSDDQKKGWRKLLEESNQLGVRGTLTKERLSSIGIESQVIGDPGFSISLRLKDSVNENYIVICPRLISSPALSEIDSNAVALLSRYIAEFPVTGPEIIIFSACYQDIAVCRLLAKCNPKVKVVEYENTKNSDSYFKLLMRASLVITMRMHPGIFAIAGGAPVIFLEKRSKYFDTVSVIPDNDNVLDPTNTSLSELNEISQHLLTEKSSARTKRLQVVKELALKQVKFFNQLRKTLS